MDDSSARPAPDELRHVHLQWFGDAQEPGGEDESQDEPADDVAKLTKERDQARKESASKDRKLTQVLNELKDLREKVDGRDKQDKRKRDLDYNDMTAEQLKREIERRDEEREAEHRREIEELRAQYRQEAVVNMASRLAPDIPNMPLWFIKLVATAAKKDVGEEELREGLEMATKQYAMDLSKNRVLIDNKEKTSWRPQTGEVSKTSIPTEKQWEKMTSADRASWLRVATPEQKEKLFEAGFK